MTFRDTLGAAPPRAGSAPKERAAVTHRERIAIGSLLFVAVAVGAPRVREGFAQPRRPPSLPAGCSSGQLVVAEGDGQFVCRPASRALQLAGCDAGDFVVSGGSGELRCERPSRTSWGARALLPECSSGASLVSEGFGRWRCADDVLPRCSSGEILVSEGGGRWRCASMPSR